MTDTELKSLKSTLKGSLPARIEPYRRVLDVADERIWLYVLYVCDTDADHANVYEVCALREFAKKLEHYPLDAEGVRKKIRAFENLKSDTMNGLMTITATIQQVYILTNIYGFTTERRGRKIRLVTDADLYIPRKFGKTHLGAFMSWLEMMTGDHDAEVYCCANAQSQAKIAYSATRSFLQQTVGLNSGLMRFTATEVNWIEGNKYGKKASLNLLSAGGKAKDGLKASFRWADEYGSAAYVKDHSDMDNLVKVIDSSMGPRFSPLRLTTTTAGRITTGPYMLRLKALQDALASDTLPPETFAYLLQPDPWEITDEELCLSSPTIHRKVNPHIGVTIQPDFYEKEVARVRLDPDYRKEFFTKLLNIFQSDKAVDWLKAEEIRPLQEPYEYINDDGEHKVVRRIEDCDPDDGWQVWCGMDFSLGNDLDAMSYLAMREDENGERHYFGDMDAWITEEVFNQATLHDLYAVWIDKGMLHLCPGKTLDPNLPVKRIMELSNYVFFKGFGYDSYRANIPVTNLKQWLVDDCGVSIKDIKNIVMPVSQQFSSYAPLVDEMTYMIKRDPPLLSLSGNDMWPWEFGNCRLQESTDGMENRKLVKSGPSQKIDNCQCLANALKVLDMQDASAQ